MITPIEQHAPALAYDSARQIMMPPPVVQAQPPPTLQDVPIQQPQPSRDSSFSFDRKHSGGDLAFEQRAQAAIAQKMWAAWSYLYQLQGEVAMAVAGGHAAAAKQVALEAASVASSIDSIARHIPLMQGGSRGGGGSYIPANLSSMTGVTAEDSVPASVSALAPATPSNVSAPTSPPPLPSASIPSIGEIMTMARSGLDVAQQVVTSAATIPFFTPQDSSAVNLSIEQVREAIIHVEAIIADISMGVVGSGFQASSGRIDVST